MSRPDVEAIEGRAEAATDGPWASVDEWVSGIGADRTFTMIEAPSRYVSRDVSNGWDADFIAHAREDVPALIAYVRELEAALASLRAPRSLRDE